MNNTDKPALPAGLESQIQLIIALEDLHSQRAYLKALVENAGFDLLDCAATLLYLLQNPARSWNASIAPAPAPQIGLFKPTGLLSIKMVRYRLDVGRQHQITVEELKKVLVEESGVDKNNIVNIDIQDSYTLIELPDEMPPDIFQHLRSVEINHKKLEIRRIKNRRPKKRGNQRYGRHRQQIAKPPEPVGFSSKN